MTTHRSWFLFILIGLSAALLVVVLVAYRPNATRVDDAPTSTALTFDEYRVAARTIVTNYYDSSVDNADEVAYDALLALRVPAESKDVHIQLVIAFGQLVAGEDIAGRARLIDLEKVYPWVSPIPAQE